MNAILEIKSLNVSFQRKDGVVKAVSDANLAIKRSSIFGLIGETGCGKSVLAHSILRLLPHNAIVTGEVFYKDQDISSLPTEAVRKLRGKEIGLIAQNPGEALNPLLKNGTQVIAPMRLHRNFSKKDSWRAAVELLEALDLPNPHQKMQEYPHQLSGGMKQRVLTALGIGGDPSLLIADEPTKGLDVLIRGQVVEVLERLKEMKETTILLITHDLQVAAHLCDELAVMYAGEIIEEGSSKELFNDPIHPYFKGLIDSLPSNGLKAIPGYSPSLVHLPQGCRFFQRCSKAQATCDKISPEIKEVTAGHKVRCRFID
ncbi:ABC transporter ATP-binding protein [Clostridium formicaceticum]|uniref:Nickel import system ATP-binding protein NikD n=1 Tax=Clostridium formicaceticum TaxID=1497 RepID=A0AAC9RM41_9CLOT|nr:ABC transporter ATP-binding protein [Clostridium formicaceticum]AOY77641.1 dipeptide ABC transporter ATP-binding protein DppD [Clostridium formicaceticum]ARE88224.1 Oligopeptide transport ATP-binding protein OppD [Clostridium formicaceticum]